MTGRTTLLVLAKAPVPGRVKTRLCPPCTPQQAADLATAALRDTLAAVLAVPDTRPLLVLDGTPPAWLTVDLEVVGQRAGALDRRLAGAFEAAGTGPALLVGMDTPQLSTAVLADAVAALRCHDAVLGAAVDGGWWALGLRNPDPRLLRGVPTSRPDTGDRQRARLAAAGLRVRALDRLRDVDTAADADAVADLAPHTEFAACWRALRSDVA